MIKHFLVCFVTVGQMFYLISDSEDRCVSLDPLKQRVKLREEGLNCSVVTNLLSNSVHSLLCMCTQRKL